MSPVQGCEDVAKKFFEHCVDNGVKLTTTADVFRLIHEDQKSEREAKIQDDKFGKTLQTLLQIVKKIDSQM